MAGTVGPLVINPAGLAAVLHSPAGPVFRHMIEVGEKVKDEARRIAPVGKPDPLGRPKADGTPIGHLRDSIVKRVTREGGNVMIHVGVWTVPYAYGVHEGNPAHVIEAKKSSVLAFMGSSGSVVYARRVNHPGNQPNRFLVRALEAVRH